MRLYNINYTHYYYDDYECEEYVDVYLDWIDMPEEVVANAILGENTLAGMDLASFFKKDTEIYKKLYDEEIEYDKDALAKLFIEHCDDVDNDEIVESIVHNGLREVDEEFDKICWEGWCEMTW